jgi:DNA-binding transcriptional LysR family regulator
MIMSTLLPGDVYVGAAPDCVEYVLPFACSARYQKEARLRVALMVAPEAVTFPALSRGDLDLIITGLDAIQRENVGCEHVYGERTFIVAAHDHPLSGRHELTLAELVGQEWAVPTEEMRDQLCELFKSRQLPVPQIALLASSSPLRMSQVASSRLIGAHPVATILALAEARTYLRILPVKDLVWRRPVLAAYRSPGGPSRAARRLMDDMKAIAISPAP